MASKTKQTGEQAADSVPDASEGDDAQQAATNGADGGGIFSELTGTAREAALSVLKPAVKSAAESAAGYAASKGPELVKSQLGPKLQEAGGLDGLADKVLSSAGGPLGKVASTLGMGGKLVDSITPGGGDDDDGEGGTTELDATGSGRRMPIQQAIDVAVPLEVAYNQWTQFEEYPSFMHRVDSASQEDDAKVNISEKVWGFGRDFQAEIVEQRPNERITWRSTGDLKHAGIVTFHELAERLTRIEVTLDFKPDSLFQKFARGTRFSKRAIRADMHRFKAYVEMAQEEDGAWLGTIEDGEVVQDHEQAQEEREAEGAETEEEGAEAQQEPEEEAESDEEESEASEEEAESEEEEPEASEEEADEEEAESDEEEAESDEEKAESDEEEEPEASEEDDSEEEEEAPAKKRPRRPQRPQRRQGGGQKGRSTQRRRQPAKQS